MTDPHENFRHRNPDYDTSVEGARAVTARAPNQRLALLAKWVEAGDRGLTDDESASAAGLLESNYWKRAGELRANGWISWHVDGLTRVGLSGTSRKVSVVTPAGIAATLMDR